jgi:hypothetical protein
MRYVLADGKYSYDRTGCSADHTNILVGTSWHALQPVCFVHEGNADRSQIRRARLFERGSKYFIQWN